jgi:hypothetical protein
MTHPCQLKNLGGEVFENGCDIDGCLGTDAHLVLGVLLQKTLDTTARELSYWSARISGSRHPNVSTKTGGDTEVQHVVRGHKSVKQ